MARPTVRYKGYSRLHLSIHPSISRLGIVASLPMLEFDQARAFRELLTVPQVRLLCACTQAGGEVQFLLGVFFIFFFHITELTKALKGTYLRFHVVQALIIFFFNIYFFVNYLPLDICHFCAEAGQHSQSVQLRPISSEVRKFTRRVQPRVRQKLVSSIIKLRRFDVQCI